MIPELDPSLANKFRNKVNEHNFIRLYFAEYADEVNREEKDVWSKICSCMDWLNVTVEGIEKPIKSKHQNMDSLHFAHFLTTVDMMLEAIKNAWLSINLATKHKRPYIKDRSIFHACEFGRSYSDEAYFKEIRAWFGIHSVNGNEVKLHGFDKDVRFFSSWSMSRFFDDDTYAVLLYSNDRKAEQMFGGEKKVCVNDLIRFILLRYKSLNQLMKDIDMLYENVKTKTRNTPIKFDKTWPTAQQLEQLYFQAKKRKLTSEWYEEEIEDCISFFKIDLLNFEPTERVIVKSYLTELEKIIPAYRDMVQNVDDTETDSFKIFHISSSLFSDRHYDISKTLEYAIKDGDYLSGEISLRILIEDKILPDYSMQLSGDCLQLLIYALDYDHYIKEPPKKKKENHGDIHIIDDISFPPEEIIIHINGKVTKKPYKDGIDDID
ncbi:MAG: hypothetical protein ABF629_04220 [Sporolactobacillus sp.]|uniref:hypothetical protein n=1 Tax=Sporolactobacillus sp. STSJ-5 TaxID=2965076 RepID=UPI0021045203|nr:hypothetical protein [Sporolactobacillus sp. STSJ-5]MCQ2009290.1 hypothetical protein [Sporolactobacillus sp. STSJ-5]